MNLIDAVKSGRPFRRACEHRSTDWNIVTDRGYVGTVSLSPADILADDWEIQEPKVEITRKEFDQAWMEVLLKLPMDEDQHYSMLTERLGL